VKVLPEVSKDFHSIKLLLEDAFDRKQEARLVEALRNAGRLAGFVALDLGAVAGYAAYSPVELESSVSVGALGLGPVAVQRARRKKGVGSALIAASLDSCRDSGHEAVFVLGEPAYYGRFGFRPAGERGLSCEYDVPKEFFLALELVPGALSAARGVVRYAPEFAECV